MRGYEEYGTITNINGDKFTIDKGQNYKLELDASDVKHEIYNIGVNPFRSDDNLNRTINFSLESILHSLGLIPGGEVSRYNIGGIPAKDVNFDPFVYTLKGKEHYQRGLCWTTEQKQALVHSIYENIGIGNVVVRRRSWQDLEKLVASGEKDIAFSDVVDGKQRLNAIAEFLNDKFTDDQGNTFSDLSYMAQHEFLNHQLLGFTEIDEKATDDYVIRQFLKTNYTGIPQSKEHIDYVRSIYSHFTK